VGKLAAGLRGKTSPPVIHQPLVEHSVSLSRFTSNSGGGSALDGLATTRPPKINPPLASAFAGRVFGKWLMAHCKFTNNFGVKP
jgi:hypothetical protein